MTLLEANIGQGSAAMLQAMAKIRFLKEPVLLGDHTFLTQGLWFWDWLRVPLEDYTRGVDLI